jgi:hypothetical protein
MVAKPIVADPHLLCRSGSSSLLEAYPDSTPHESVAKSAITGLETFQSSTVSLKCSMMSLHVSICVSLYSSRIFTLMPSRILLFPFDAGQVQVRIPKMPLTMIRIQIRMDPPWFVSLERIQIQIHMDPPWFVSQIPIPIRIEIKKTGSGSQIRLDTNTEPQH